MEGSTLKIILVPSAVGTEEDEPLNYMTSIVINDTVAIDAGCLGLYLDPRDQARIRHLFVTHSHIDHVGSLPIFVENAYEAKPDPVTIHATEPVHKSIQSDLFNNILWPDFIALSRATPKAPFLQLATLVPGQPVEVEGIRLTPISVDHVVPTVGFVVEDATTSVVFSSDTAPTHDIWQIAHSLPNLKAVFVEATFPNHLKWLADVSKHLTPAYFAGEVAKINRNVPIIAVHIKPRFRAEVVKELGALGLSNLTIGKYGVKNAYHF
jgi:ribonuclease BN (tRNA processing enzyme)